MSSSQGNSPAGADPSMEDILASIRRILSEDDTGTAVPVQATVPGTPTQSVPQPAPQVAPQLAPAPRNVLALDASMLVREPQAPSAMAANPPLAGLNTIGAPPPAPVPVLPALQFEAPTPVQPKAPEPGLQSAPPGPPAFEPAPRPLAMDDDAALVAPEAAAAAASVGNLMRTLVVERQTAVYRGGPTLEDLVREEMRPLLKQWLDTHLPPMVERLVRVEIERVVSRAVS